MTKKTTFSLILLAVFSILSICAFIVSKNIMKDINVSGHNSKSDEQVGLKELIITETRDGQKFWEVYADSGHYNNGTNVAVLNNITGNFYKEGKVVLSVASPIAVYDSDKKEITLKGGARAANDKDIYISADEICWAGANDEIKARGNVKIIRDNQVMTISNESSFDTGFTNLKISGDANTYVFSF